MTELEITTQKNILAAGRREFLAKGFRAVSLRSIVREAGVTTGAFYGYYKNKEALFNALAARPAQTLLEKYEEVQRAFAALAPEEQLTQMGKISADCMDWMLEHIYAHCDAFKLILCHAKGTQHEHFVHTLVEIEVEATHRFLAVLRVLGHPVEEIEPQLEHILVSGLFSGFFEMVVHEMPRAQAVRYLRGLREFYTAGWKKLLGL